MRANRSALPARLLLVLAGLAALLAGAVATAQAASVTVRPGDTLSAIAARNGTSVAALARANGIANPDVVSAGARLVLPAAGASSMSVAPAAAAGDHVVRPGDTLFAIATRNGTTVEALARANGIADPHLLSVGRRLTIPGGSSASAPAAAPAAPAPGGATHVVRAGETLAAIAAARGTTPEALARLNGLADPNALSVGQRLTVPGPQPALPGATPTSSTEVASLIQSYAGRHGVDPALARAIAWQESRWTQSARSSAGAIGVMQLMPSTARWLGPAVLGRRIDPHRLQDNIEGGVAYLGWLHRQAGGDVRTAIGAYYQGLGAMRERGPYDDTRDYIASVLSFRGRV